MCVHGVWIMPPPQPKGDAQKQTSWAERGVIILPLVAMHMRSEAASAPAKAQQHPQLDWSRMSPMTVGVGRGVGDKRSLDCCFSYLTSEMEENKDCQGNRREMPLLLVLTGRW
jgi:hypothetical protein